MIISNIDRDLQQARLSITAEFDATIERAWQLWADPRQLERWWGPPEYPATFVEHDLRPGGTATYFMTGPDGEQFHGWWSIVEVIAPEHLSFEDGFADDAGTRNDELPVTRVTIALADGDESGTLMTIHSQFASTEAMEQLLEMGMEEGFVTGLGQIDAILLADSQAN